MLDLNYHVVSSCAKMPNGIFAPYRHVAVIGTINGYVPTRIDHRPRDVVSVYDVAKNAHLGFKPRGNTAAEIALREARTLAKKLNERPFTDY